MIQTIVYEHDQAAREIAFDRLSEVIKQPKNLVWVDVEQPTPDDLQALVREFGFHPLSIEDVSHGHQRPKLDDYGSYFFVVTKAIRYDPKAIELELVEISHFIGRNYVVTVHDGSCDALDDALARVRAHPHVLEEGIGLLVYTIMDSIIDVFLPVLDVLDEQINDLEESIFNGFDPQSISTIFRLKRELLKVRRSVGHMRDVFNILARRDQPIFTAQAVVYFQDIYDHLYRITDAVDLYRDTLTSALDAYVSVNANKLNEVMKMFAGVSIILMTAALVAGIYGMNFKCIPELDWPHGYPASLALMVVLGAVEYWLFRRKGWL